MVIQTIQSTFSPAEGPPLPFKKLDGLDDHPKIMPRSSKIVFGINYRFCYINKTAQCFSTLVCNPTELILGFISFHKIFQLYPASVIFEQMDWVF